MSEATLDQLAGELDRAVRHAVEMRTNAKAVAEFGGMRTKVTEVLDDVRECVAVLYTPSPLTLEPEVRAHLDERIQWVRAQVDKVRATLAEDPGKLRQGKLWTETQRALRTLRDELSESRDTAYETLIESFSADDEGLIATLPPGTDGARDYRDLVRDFAALRDRPPRSADEVREVAAVGRRLTEVRDRVEAHAVPPEFQEAWNLLRGATGLPLTRLTPEFQQWLQERGLTASTMLVYRPTR